MKLFIVFASVIFLSACAKKSDNDDLMVVCPPAVDMSWLEAKKTEYKPCICLTGIKRGIYDNQVVFEVYFYDPACFGANVVYGMDGTKLFISGDPIYADYTAKVKEEKIIWTCKEGNQ